MATRCGRCLLLLPILAESFFDIVLQVSNEAEEPLTFSVEVSVAKLLVERFGPSLYRRDTDVRGSVETVREDLLVAACDNVVPDSSNAVRKTGHLNSSFGGWRRGGSL
jgi:hypothetical protein